MATDPDLQPYLAPAAFVDSGAPNVADFARHAAGSAHDPLTRAVRLYYAVRDDIIYTPYCDFTDPDTFRASACLARGSGFCVGKASLLTAAARAAGIPARIGFADVRNHLCTPKLRALMGTDTFVYHGYTDLYLDGRWVKATPAFNRELCEKFGVKALEFDGHADSLFQPFDVEGRRHMEYLRDRGARVDVPVAEIMAAFAEHYPGLTARRAAAPPTQFGKEAEELRDRS
jgi:Transglutaminase-like enzymes, putative cysteine proteases